MLLGLSGTLLDYLIMISRLLLWYIPNNKKHTVCSYSFFLLRLNTQYGFLYSPDESESYFFVVYCAICSLKLAAAI